MVRKFNLDSCDGQRMYYCLIPKQVGKWDGLGLCLFHVVLLYPFHLYDL